MGLEAEFSDENVRAYSKACVDIADSLLVRSKDDGFDTLLIPSRGAVPFFIGAVYALQELAETFPDAKSLLGKLRIPNMMREYVLPADLSRANEPTKKPVNVLFMPFTADINMQPFAEQNSIEESVSSEEFVNRTRLYWTKVVKGLAQGGKRRAESPHLQFYLFLLREHERRPDIAEEYESSPRVDEIVMIDTVISGRASTTIIDGFAQEKMSPHCLLIVDNNGNSYKQPYKTQIEIGKSRGMIETFMIPKIFSEDRGASLEGVIGVVYPSLMYQATGLMLNGQYFFPAGAGSWYPLREGDTHKKAFLSFCRMLRAGVSLSCEEYSSCPDAETHQKSLDANRRILLETLRKYDLLSQNPEQLRKVKLVQANPKTIYETSSHVVHVPYPEGYTREVLARFRRKFESQFQ